MPVAVILALKFPLEHDCFFGASGTFDVDVAIADHSTGSAVGVVPKVDFLISTSGGWARRIEMIHNITSNY
jgi:hypothetical protein